MSIETTYKIRFVMLLLALCCFMKACMRDDLLAELAMLIAIMAIGRTA